MKAGREITSHVLLGSRTKSGRYMAKKKTYRQFSNDLHRGKTGKRRRRNAEYHPTETTKVQDEKRCRVGGSTTHVLPEPRAGKVENEIIRIDTPPPPEPNI